MVYSHTEGKQAPGTGRNSQFRGAPSPETVKEDAKGMKHYFSQIKKEIGLLVKIWISCIFVRSEEHTSELQSR